MLLSEYLIIRGKINEEKMKEPKQGEKGGRTQWRDVVRRVTKS